MVSKELSYLIENLGLGWTGGNNLFISNDTPTKPDKILVIRLDGTAQPDVSNIDYQRIAFKVIGRDSVGEQQRCEKSVDDVRVAFRAIGGEDILYSKFISIDHVFGPVDMGVDSTMRPLYRADFVVNRTGSVKEFYYEHTGDSR